MELIGERLRRCRLERGLSKRAIATRLGVSVPTVMRWEEGASVPNDYNRHKLERLLAELEAGLPLFDSSRVREVPLELFDKVT
ncbi:helix-turn-helix domain-containing protein [Candidatus Bipolaricaulota bacterium]|nr:helix-turn-helix domain-containing protein [Candidatus Bipolaricaulota bacterium]